MFGTCERGSDTGMENAERPERKTGTERQLWWGNRNMRREPTIRPEREPEREVQRVSRSIPLIRPLIQK